MEKYNNIDIVTIVGGLSGLALAAFIWMQRKEESDNTPTTTTEWLQLAKKRLSHVCPPLQSSFRVYSIITWRNIRSGETGWVSGTNSESAYIGGSICAERAAAVQLRELPQSTTVTAIYLISDLQNDCITPGLLCREYLLSCVALDVPIHLGNSDISKTRKTTLKELFPYPSMYEKIPRDELLKQGKEYAEKYGPILYERKWAPLFKAVNEVVKNDTFGAHIHPIQYAAGITFEDGTISVSWQKAEIEYGGTVDAVTGLFGDIEKNGDTNQPVLLLMIDQFGLPHAPFAPARAQLFERGFTELIVFVVDHITGKFEEVNLDQLVPDCPKMSELWPGADR
jgi:cytidine deaminase